MSCFEGEKSRSMAAGDFRAVTIYLFRAGVGNCRRVAARVELAVTSSRWPAVPFHPTIPSGTLLHHSAGSLSPRLLRILRPPPTGDGRSNGDNPSADI
jgi:hypothetical protein